MFEVVRSRRDLRSSQSLHLRGEETLVQRIKCLIQGHLENDRTELSCSYFSTLCFILLVLARNVISRDKPIFFI